MGYGPEFDEWLLPRNLRNAPELLVQWQVTKDTNSTKKHEADVPTTGDIGHKEHIKRKRS